MKQGNNWSGYDRNFRKDLEAMHYSWSTIRFDRIMQYTVHTMKKNTDHFKKSPGSVIQDFYRFYNSERKTCFKSNCPKKHACSRCNLQHPIYLCRRASNFGRDSARVGYDRNAARQITAGRNVTKLGSSNNPCAANMGRNQ